MVKKPLSPCQQCQQTLGHCREQLGQALQRQKEAESLLLEAKAVLEKGAVELRRGAIRELAAGAEPHWLTKDFNVLYRCAQRVVDVSRSENPAGSAELAMLIAQLERLRPAFTDTEEVRELMRSRQG